MYCCALELCENAFFSTTTSSNQVLDLACTQHFTGSTSDLKLIKRQSSTKLVKVLNGALVEAISYRDVNYRGVTLKDVQLVPSFSSVKLVLVKALTKD